MKEASTISAVAGPEACHILEDQIRSAVPSDVYDRQVGVMADALDTDEISRAVRATREYRAQPEHQEPGT